MTEKEYIARTKKGEPIMRSCWKCNSAHTHLKTADYLIWCFLCGKVYYKGKQIKRLEKDDENEKIQHFKKNDR